MKETGFGVKIEVIKCPEGTALVIRNDLAELEKTEYGYQSFNRRGFPRELFEKHNQREV